MCKVCSCKDMTPGPNSTSKASSRGEDCPSPYKQTNNSVQIKPNQQRQSYKPTTLSKANQTNNEFSGSIKHRRTSTRSAKIGDYLQKLKTRVIKKDVNPEWNEDLTLAVADANLPVKLTVYDRDSFNKDDKIGDAEIDIKPFLEALKMNLSSLSDGTVITGIRPCRSNCLTEESNVVWKDGQVVQDMCLRLRNVECGEVELQLQWIDLPGSKGL